MDTIKPGIVVYHKNDSIILYYIYRNAFGGEHHEKENGSDFVGCYHDI